MQRLNGRIILLLFLVQMTKKNIRLLCGCNTSPVGGAATCVHYLLNCKSRTAGSACSQQLEKFEIHLETCFLKEKKRKRRSSWNKFCCWTSELHVWRWINLIKPKREFSAFLLRRWRWWTPSGRRNLWIWVLSRTAASPRVTMSVGQQAQGRFRSRRPPLKLCMHENVKSGKAWSGFVKCLLLRYDRDRQERGDHCCHPEECWRNYGSL